MKNPTRMSAMKLAIGPTAHLEKTNQWDKAVEYCQKEETRVKGPWQFGEQKGQGHRRDLEDLTTMVVKGKTMKDIAMTDPVGFARYSKGLQVLQQTIHKPKALERRCALLWGRTGTGKTRMVFDTWKADDIYTVFNITTPWFDGYQQEETVLFDECGPGMMDINMLKRLTDRYPMTVPIKGASTPWNARTIVLTSNTPIEEWYPLSKKDDMDALKRRLAIFEFPQDKWLAEAWCKGGAIKRSREVLDVETDDGEITVLGGEPAATWVD